MAGIPSNDSKKVSTAVLIPPTTISGVFPGVSGLLNDGGALSSRISVSAPSLTIAPYT